MIGSLREDAKDKFKLYEQQWVATACGDSFKINLAAPFFVDHMFADPT